MPSGPSAWALIGIGRSYWWRRGNRRGGATNQDNFAVLHIEFAQKIISCYVPELAPGKGHVYYTILNGPYPLEGMTSYRLGDAVRVKKLLEGRGLFMV